MSHSRDGPVTKVSPEGTRDSQWRPGRVMELTSTARSVSDREKSEHSRPDPNSAPTLLPSPHARTPQTAIAGRVSEREKSRHSRSDPNPPHHHPRHGCRASVCSGGAIG